MSVHKSAHNGGVYLQRGTAAPIDISGLASDGRARANSYALDIPYETVSVTGYRQKHAETVPLGQGNWTFDITVFWGSVRNEPVNLLNTMHAEQHEVAACGDPQEYRLLFYPEDECTGSEVWQLDGAVIASRTFNAPTDDVLTADASFGGHVATWGCVQRITVIVSIEYEAGADTTAARAAAEAAVAAYFNVLDIGDTIVNTPLIATIEAITGVYDAFVSFSAPTGSTSQDADCPKLFIRDTETYNETFRQTQNVEVYYGGTPGDVESCAEAGAIEYLGTLNPGDTLVVSDLQSYIRGASGESGCSSDPLVNTLDVTTPGSDVVVASNIRLVIGTVTVSGGS